MPRPSPSILDDQQAVVQHLFDSVVSDKTRDVHYSVGEQLSGIYHAVQWGEPLVVGALAAHAALFLTTLALRRHVAAQAVILALCFTGVMLAEHLNQYLAPRWRSIASQPYFDDRGLFMTLLLSAPLTVVALTAVVQLLVQSSKLLITVKAKQLGDLRKARRRAEQDASVLASNGHVAGADETQTLRQRQRHEAAARSAPLD
jgi:hypothetical protein